MIDISALFANLGSLAGLSVLVSGFVIGKLKQFPFSQVNIFGLVKVTQLVSWVIAVVLTFVGFFLDLTPALAGNSIVFVGIFGIGVGFVSNAVADIAVVQKVLDFIKSKFFTK